MSDEIRRENMQHSDSSFERQDLTPRSIFVFLATMAVCGILIHLALTGAYHYMEKYQRPNQVAPGPLATTTEPYSRHVSREDIKKVFPEPRLEENERLELHDFRLKEEEELNSYGWVDQQAGKVHIPIDRAMDLIAQQGLPTRTQTGTVPFSSVNVARQAARQSDTSRMPAEKKQH